MCTPQYSRRRRGGRIAFVSCTMLLLGCLFVLSGCGLTPSRRPTVTLPGPLPTPTPGPSQPVILQDIHMLDEQNGWAVTKDKHILHTTSGAATWREAMPRTGNITYTPGTYNFLDVQNAWVAMQTGDKFSIFRTYNGGGFWLETPLLDAGNGVSQISFADAQNGWLLFDKKSGTEGQAVDIFHTNDGGNSWLLISNVDSKTGDLRGALPFVGRKTGISFHSSAIGWVTGSVTDSKHPLLYMTSDGGFSWEPQTLSLPAGASGTITTFAPKFSSAKDGILPVTFSANGNKVVFYSTQDGGKTWSAGPATTEVGTTLSFASDNQAWAIGSNGENVYATSDSGRSWKQLAKPAATARKLLNIDFLSATQGWVLADMDDTTSLFQVTGDGKSWTRLNTTASA